jgi:hypothetical protein
MKLIIITTTTLTFGMGASTQALFARVGVEFLLKLLMWEPIWWEKWKKVFRRRSSKSCNHCG